MAGSLVGGEGAELMEGFAGVIKRDARERAEAADVVGVKVGEEDGGEAIGGEGILRESEGEEAAVETGGEALGFGEVRAVAGVEQDETGFRVAESGDESGEGDLRKAAIAVNEPGALAAVATGVEGEVDEGHRLQATPASEKGPRAPSARSISLGGKVDQLKLPM